MDLLYLGLIRQVELDTLCWNPSPLNVFEVKSYYKMLHSTPHLSFPWCCMWKPKVSSFGIAALGRIVTVDSLGKRQIIIRLVLYV